MTAARNCSVTLDKNELQLWDGMERMMLYFALGERWLANCNPHMNVGCALHCLDMLCSPLFRVFLHGWLSSQRHQDSFAAFM